MKFLVIVIAVLQAAFIAMFAALAVSGDSWGIARAVALLLSIPFVCLTVPALILTWKGDRRTGAMLAVLSLVDPWAAWSFA